MGLRLVNIFPRSSSDYIKPTQPIHLGLKSDGVLATPKGSVILGSLRASLGYTSIQNEGLLPEESEVLKDLGVSVALDSAELVRPVGSEIGRVPFGTGIKLTSAVTQPAVGVYGIKVGIEKDASIMGYLKFRSNTSWSLATREWCSLSNMTGLYFGLEDGPSNTICWAGLRGSGNGSLVIGGPMQLFNTARPSQREITAFDWAAQPNGTILEMWIVFNRTGFPNPFSPANTPVLEVWTKRDGVDTVPVCHTLLSPIPIGALGQFPATQADFPNFRVAPTNTATLYFGNVGSGADELELLDWALFPDYRVSVSEGGAVGKTKVTAHSDSPYEYNCADGLPQDLAPGRWFPMGDVGFFDPSASLHYTPAKSEPNYLSIDKKLLGGTGFHREEPRLEKKDDGAVIEAFMFSELTSKPAESSGTGLAIDDGTNLFQVIALESSTRRTYGLAKPGVVGDFNNSYFTPSADFDPKLDWRSPKLVRLVVDRLRGRVSVVVDGTRYIDEAIASMPGSVSPVGGRVAFGHVEAAATVAKHNVIFLRYLTRYVAWELDEQLPPDTAPAGFTLTSNGVGSEALDPAPPDATALKIVKTDFDTINSHRYFYKTIPTFNERHGIQVDFRARVASYTDRLGTAYAKKTQIGAGIQVFLGNKRLHLGFFDGGAGRFIGIVPGSGNVEDIINQTSLGRAFSYPLEWTSTSTIRLSYRPYVSIDVYVDNLQTGPVISIPWRDATLGFDLPQDTTIPSIAFGHFDHDTSSTTYWEFFRYGFGNGYDVAIEPLFDSPLKSYLFGGRALIQSEFDE